VPAVSSSGIRLIVGLGNPGAEYEDTRHNAGAWFVLALAQQFRATLRRATKLQGLHATTTMQGEDCHLFIPSVYMNESGQAVQAISSYYKIAPDAILIAHDDIDLEAGDIRLKFDGGHGGHNGLRDIIQHLNTNQFYRLRIGVGHPRNSKEVVDYVLHPPKKIEREQIQNALQKADEIIPLLIDGQFQKAMQKLHTE
jgi:PTH1 family peptidyl-tRNA hydrolase